MRSFFFLIQRHYSLTNVKITLFSRNNVSRVYTIFALETIALITFKISLCSKLIIMIVRFLLYYSKKLYYYTIVKIKFETQKQIFTVSLKKYILKFKIL